MFWIFAPFLVGTRRKLTVLYHLTNCSGRLYFFAWSRRSSTSFGKTDSNSLRVVVLAMSMIAVDVTVGRSGLIVEVLRKECRVENSVINDSQSPKAV